MTAPALIGIDWGTTSFRAYLMDGRGTVLEQRTAPAGILQVPEMRFEETFERELQPWLAREPDIPIVASGMIGSRQGWVEVPYLACPAGRRTLAGALHRHVTGRGRNLSFVPGLQRRGADGVPDVMRGEETQLVGAIFGQPDGRLFLLPGTHSKWARVDERQIVWFATFMTGELFAVLKQHSILGRLMEDDGHDAEAFARGAHYGLAGDPSTGGLLERLFSARTLPLLGELPGTAVASYLSGLLLGTEVREASAALGDLARDKVVLVGGAALVTRYAAVLEQAGLVSVSAQPDAAAYGHHLIAEAAGLLE